MTAEDLNNTCIFLQEMYLDGPFPPCVEELLREGIVAATDRNDPEASRAAFAAARRYAVRDCLGREED